MILNQLNRPSMYRLKKLVQKKRMKTSDVWNYFVELPIGVDKKKKAKCSRCGAVRVAGTKNGTGSMKSILKNVYEGLMKIVVKCC